MPWPADGRLLTRYPCTVGPVLSSRSASEVDVSCAMSPGISACARLVIAAFDPVIERIKSSGVTRWSPFSEPPDSRSSPVGRSESPSIPGLVGLCSSKVALHSCFVASVFASSN